MYHRHHMPTARQRPSWRSAVLPVLLLGVVAQVGGSAQQPAPAAPPAAGPAAPQVAGPAAPPVTGEDAKARDTFIRVCVKCHTAERVTAEGRSRSQWENTIVSMQTARGAVVTPQEFDVVLNYLTKFHSRDQPASAVSGGAPAADGRGAPAAGGRGPRANVGAADRHRVDPAGAERGLKLYAAECVTCHVVCTIVKL
jgi:cytochrome c5